MIYGMAAIVITMIIRNGRKATELQEALREEKGATS
jgi:hypothetical protein